jgi:hypothetical protein
VFAGIEDVGIGAAEVRAGAADVGAEVVDDTHPESMNAHTSRMARGTNALS